MWQRKDKQERGFVGYTREGTNEGRRYHLEVEMKKSELLDHYKYKHDTDRLFSKGSSLLKHVPYLARIIKDYRVESVLDYGCGKATWWNYEYMRATFDGWLGKVTLYDPAVSKYDQLPEGRFDLVVCTDVLEHIHPDDTHEVVDRLIRYTRRHLFCCIALTPAKKTFPDGTNLHINLRSQEKWEKLFADRVKTYQESTNSYITYQLSFNDRVFF